MTKPLSPTQLQILTAAAQSPARLAEAPPNLPAAARTAVFQSMLRAGLLEEVPAPDGGTTIALRITAAGLAAVGAPDAAETAADVQEGGGLPPARSATLEGLGQPVASEVPRQTGTTLRAAVTALLVACDAGLECSALPASIEALRAALGRGGVTRPARDPSARRRPREGTKHQAVLILLRRDEGATIT
ncbi:hypothetical protein, partial [Roseomonas sp. SXEYE001]